jgi:hypothetical protein
MASPSHSIEVRTLGEHTTALLSSSLDAPQPSFALRLMLLLTVALTAATTFVLLRLPLTVGYHCVCCHVATPQAGGVAHILECI